MAEIFKQQQTGINIESIDDEIDYRTILAILTAKGFVHENFQELLQSLLNELREFFTEIVEEGQKNREIRQDLPNEDIVESLIIMYMGIAYKWEAYIIDDMLSVFEDNFDLQWEKIRFRE